MAKKIPRPKRRPRKLGRKKLAALKGIIERRKARRQNGVLGFSIGRWLLDHPGIASQAIWREPWGDAVEYVHWSSGYKASLQDAYNEITDAIKRGTSYTGLPETPQLAVTPAGGQPARTLLSTMPARQMYLYHVAWSLAVEVERWVPWTLESFSPAHLAMLLDSASIFSWVESANDFEIQWATYGRATPGDPLRTFEFLETNGIIADDEVLTVARCLEWCRNNLRHYLGGDEAANYLDHWQFAGLPPVERIISGTIKPTSEPWGFGHWTAGCWGTTGFLKAVLRTVNVPVMLVPRGHALVGFPRIGRYLSHGDDPYTWHSFATPPIPPEELLIDQATFDAWFSYSLGWDQITRNVGRRVQELAVEYLSNGLLRLHCQDLQEGLGHADGHVYDDLKRTFTLEALEAVNLWSRMDAKIAAMGGCASVPSR